MDILSQLSQNLLFYRRIRGAHEGKKKARREPQRSRLCLLWHIIQSYPQPTNWGTQRVIWDFWKVDCTIGRPSEHVSAALYRLYSELQSPGPLSHPKTSTSKVYKSPGPGIGDFEDLFYNLPPQHIQRCMGCTSPVVRELFPSHQEIGALLSIQLHPVADNHFLKSTTTICGYSLRAEGSARLLQNWWLCLLQVTFKLATVSDPEVPG